MIWGYGDAQQEAVGSLKPIPAELMRDEHLLEEYGVNSITTPSIERIFELLKGLGKLQYDQQKRDILRKTPSDRVMVSLGLGTLIADAFVLVQCERIDNMEVVGRSLIQYAKVLGAGDRMNRHTKSLIEHSVNGDWLALRKELALTQVDVEAEMVTLRDVDIAHLVSLGGWMRALQIASRHHVKEAGEGLVVVPSAVLSDVEIVDYYLSSLTTLSPVLAQHELIKGLVSGLEQLKVWQGTKGLSHSKEDLEELAEIARRLIEPVDAVMVVKP